MIYIIDNEEFAKDVSEGSQLIINTFSVDIIIPFKNSTIERERNLFFVIKYYKKYLPYSNIILVEQDTTTDLKDLSILVSKHIHILNTNSLFRKTYLFNQGFNLRMSKYLILADSDCVIDRNVLINFDDYRSLFDTTYVIPYTNKVKYLSEELTVNFINNQLENDGINSEIDDGVHYAIGGIGIINSDIYYKIGGYDERYKGWGFEDDSFHNKSIGLGVTISRIGGDLIHLCHPSAFSMGVSGYYDNSLVYNTYLDKNLQDYVNELGYSHLSKNIDYSRIKIISNSYHNDLEIESKNFYSNIDFEKIKVDGSTGIYGLSFFEYVIKNINNCDWMIYIDEDCFITNQSAMLDLLFHQIKNNIAFSGMPDGGVISHRFHNPVSINAFFTIINLKMLRNIYKGGDQSYSNDLDKFVPHSLIKTNIPHNEKYSRTIADGFKPYGVLYDNFEPYYKIFFSLLRNGGIPLYLDAYDSDLDDLTTVLKNHNGVEFAYHTWFSRAWPSEPHKQRILNVINYCKSIKK